MNIQKNRPLTSGDGNGFDANCSNQAEQKFSTQAKGFKSRSVELGSSLRSVKSNGGTFGRSDGRPGKLMSERTGEKQAMPMLQAYIKIHNSIPTVRRLSRLTSCSRHVAKRLILCVKETFERRQKRIAYIGNLVNSITCSISSSSSGTLNTAFSDSLRKQINQATYCLFNLFPSHLYHLTVEVPILDDFVDLVIIYQENLAVRFIERLNAFLPGHAQIQHYLFRLSRQPSYKSNRLHFHFVVVIECSPSESDLHSWVRETWFDELEDIDRRTGCDPFLSADGKLFARDSKDHLIEVGTWKEQPGQTDFENVYWAQSEQTSRYLECVDRYVDLKVHAGVSPALRELVRKNTLVERIPFGTSQGAWNLLNELKDQIDAAFEEHRSRYGVLGVKARLSRSQFAAVIDSLTRAAQVALNASQSTLEDAPYRLTLVLQPDRHLQLKVTASHKNIRRRREHLDEVERDRKRLARR